MESKNRSEKILTIAVGLILAAAVYLFMNADRFFSGASKDLSSSIGQISYRSNDVRYKAVEKIAWLEAGRENPIFWDDSVFAGQGSQAKVSLKNGSNVVIQENSLVTFRKNQGDQLLQFSTGHFDLQVYGKTAIDLNGKLTEFSGDGARVQIKVDEKTKTSELLVTAGVLQIKDAMGRVSTLNPNQSLEFGQNVKKENPLPAPVPENKGGDLWVYYYRFHDQYSVGSDNTVSKKGSASYQINAEGLLKWSNVPEATSYEFVLDTDESFQKPKMQKNVNQPQLKLRLSEAQRYFWKVRAANDKREVKNGPWSPVESLVVEAQVHAESPMPAQPYQEEKFVKLNETVNLGFSWQEVSAFEFYILELSRRPEFPVDGTRVFWLPQKNLRYTTGEDGRYYWRVRGVRENLELSEFSEVRSFEVLTPSRLAAPNLPTKPIDLPFDLAKREALTWSPVSGAEGYQLSIYAPDRRRIESVKLREPLYPYKNQTPGNYLYQVKAIDHYRRYGDPSKFKKFTIQPKPAIELAKKKEKPKRKVASEKATVKTKIEEEKVDPNKYNRDYKKSYVQVEGASFIQNSKERFNQGEEFALAMTTSVRGMYWFAPSQGAEGSFRAKVVGYNDTGNNISPMLLEARYHYRFIWPFRWFYFLPEIHFSLFTGIEYFTNNTKNGVELTEQYTLMKTGAALKFPAWDRWETGGEVAVGWWLDARRKYEIQGYLNYFFKPRWTLGVGYRLNLFDAGSAGLSPTGELPHREAYGEAYGNLRYSF